MKKSRRKLGSLVGSSLDSSMNRGTRQTLGVIRGRKLVNMAVERDVVIPAEGISTKTKENLEPNLAKPFIGSKSASVLTVQDMNTSEVSPTQDVNMHLITASSDQDLQLPSANTPFSAESTSVFATSEVSPSQDVNMHLNTTSSDQDLQLPSDNTLFSAQSTSVLTVQDMNSSEVTANQDVNMHLITASSDQDLQLPSANTLFSAESTSVLATSEVSPTQDVNMHLNTTSSDQDLQLPSDNTLFSAQSTSVLTVQDMNSSEVTVNQDVNMHLITASSDQDLQLPSANTLFSAESTSVLATSEVSPTQDVNMHLNTTSSDQDLQLPSDNTLFSAQSTSVLTVQDMNTSEVSPTQDVNMHLITASSDQDLQLPSANTLFSAESTSVLATSEVSPTQDVDMHLITTSSDQDLQLPSANALFGADQQRRPRSTSVFDVQDINVSEVTPTKLDCIISEQYLQPNSADPLFSTRSAVISPENDLNASRIDVRQVSVSESDSSDLFSGTDSDDDRTYVPPLDSQQNLQPNASSEDIQPPGHNEMKKKTRAKRGRADKSKWRNNDNKSKRMKGAEYLGRRKNEEGKIVFDVEKSKKIVKPRCLHKNSKIYGCEKMHEESRQQIFDEFWNLSWESKKVYVRTSVTKRPITQRKSTTTNNRRENTLVYHLKTAGENIKVCKTMYLNTLNIGEWSVRNWTSVPETNREPELAERSKRNADLKKKEEESRQYVTDFFSKLPKLESHYCRKSSSKLYLEPLWQSKARLYREYLHYLNTVDKERYKVSIFIFSEIFENHNLSLFSPKKDQCDTCCAKNVNNIDDEVYNAHILRKDQARAEKMADKDSNDESVAVYTMDLQAVLLAPSLKASALYYKTKLKIHNFTLYDLKTGEGFCFIWNESEGGVTADEFSSILFHFLINIVDKNIVKHVIFFSDGCTYQNRNATLANTLLLASKKTGLTITQKILEKGHTQMECDSMHSTIERQLRNREIYSPSGYVEVCRTARLRPYVVKYLDHTFFRKFSTLPYITSIRPGSRVGDPTVTDLCCIRYTPDCNIIVKTNFTDEFRQLPRRIQKPNIEDTVPALHKERIPIQRSKYIHLQELKLVLPQDVHPFYDNLPHICPNINNCKCKI